MAENHDDPLTTAIEQELELTTVGERTAKKEGLKLARQNIKSISEQLLVTLANSFSNEEIVEAIRDLLAATYTNSKGKEFPDYRTRERGVSLYLDYIVGKPVQRQEQVNYNYDINDLDEKGLVETMANSPAVLAKVLEMTAKAEEMAMRKVEGEVK